MFISNTVFYEAEIDCPYYSKCSNDIYSCNDTIIYSGDHYTENYLILKCLADGKTTKQLVSSNWNTGSSQYKCSSSLLSDCCSWEVDDDNNIMIWIHHHVMILSIAINSFVHIKL